MMMTETPLHFISAIIILLSALVPIYLTVKLKNHSLKKLTIILSIFILIHALYHITGFFGFNLLADGVLEPLSVVVLIFFGIVYSAIIGAKPTNTNTGIKNMAVVVAVAIGAENNDTLPVLMNSITIILLLVALGIFVWLATRSKNIRTFQFQISIFIVIWIMGDMISVLHDNGIAVFPSILQGGGVEIGSGIHVASMAFFSLMLWLRYYYSERSGQKMVEDVNVDAASNNNLG
jgi:hypothetical protein